MIELENHMTWPRIDSLWQHLNGNYYSVLMFTNVETEKQEDYPTTIVYRNTSNLKCYSRKLMDWDRSMLLISNGNEKND